MAATSDRDLAIQEIAKMKQYFAKDSFADYKVVQRNDRSFEIHPKSRVALSERRIDLTLQCLIHGNEVGGVFALSEIIRLIENGVIAPHLSIALHLGNIEALEKGVRFTEMDLNRVFGNQEAKTHEHRLARDIELLYRDSEFVIDVHQTQGPCKDAFFISRFDPVSFKLMRLLSPLTCVVTYFDKNFSKSEMTTINYHLKEGGHGFGLELGEKGVNVQQIEFGVAIILKAIATLSKVARNASSLSNDAFENVFVFEDSMRSYSGNYALNPGFENMTEVKEGDAMGEIDGRPVVATITGRILFPNYRKLGNEVCRLAGVADPVFIRQMMKEK